MEENRIDLDTAPVEEICRQVVRPCLAMCELLDAFKEIKSVMGWDVSIRGWPLVLDEIRLRYKELAYVVPRDEELEQLISNELAEVEHARLVMMI
jgi:hypothetical protein